MPCFNEEKNIEIAVNNAYRILPKIAKKWELIVVNDGSTDLSLKIVNKLIKKNKNIKIINHQKNLGYGAALKSGFKKAKYDWIFFTDSDLQFNVEQLYEFMKYIDKFSIIIGFRKKRAEGFRRSLSANLYKIFIDCLFRIHVKDIDCAFKLLKAKEIKSLNLLANGAMVSAEMLYLFKKKGLIFKQIPVDHKLRLFGKPTGNNLKVIIRAIKEALSLYIKIKFNFNCL